MTCPPATSINLVRGDCPTPPISRCTGDQCRPKSCDTTKSTWDPDHPPMVTPAKKSQRHCSRSRNSTVSPTDLLPNQQPGTGACGRTTTSGWVQLRLPLAKREQKIRASGAASLEAEYQVQSNDPSGSSASDPPWLQGNSPEALIKQPSNWALDGSEWIEREISSKAEKLGSFFAAALGASTTPRKQRRPMIIAKGVKPMNNDKRDLRGLNAFGRE